ncbi:MAG TPA: response regulator transcription factor [Chloroflexota bacterium]|nr:response regulator transcription factor [Chloroflexota bacterium]HZU06246.1 response regulator transcription factor [Chloroflexota bacterium]
MATDGDQAAGPMRERAKVWAHCPASIRVVIVDDHPMVLAGMQTWLERAGGVQVVGTAMLGAETLPLVEAHRPDVLLLDVRLPDMSGIEVARQVRRRAPEVAVLAITGDPNSGDERTLRQMGALGYLPKTVGAAELAKAVRLVAQGQAVQVVETGRTGIGSTVQVDLHVEPATSIAREHLTPRERESLQLLVLDHSNDEIAAALGLSAKTAADHLSHLIEKFHVHSRMGVVVQALQSGLLTLPATDGNRISVA